MRRLLLIAVLGGTMIGTVAAQMTAPTWNQARVTHGPTMPPGPDEPIR